MRPGLVRVEWFAIGESGVVLRLGRLEWGWVWLD